MIVMKFGGTSVQCRDRLRAAATLSAGVDGPVAVVVSALGGATDVLLEMGRRAERGDREGALGELSSLRSRHELAAASTADFDLLVPMFDDLRDLLHGVGLLGEQTSRSRAMLASFGERLCAPLFAGWCREIGLRAQAVDARDLLVTDDRHESASVDMAASAARVEERLRPLLAAGIVPIITGFIGASADGVTTVLGRGGSDWSGALFGALLQAREIVIWTDVPGILTADPRVVRDARTLPAVSYREAAEMSYFGAKVVHPKTMLPARERGIPVLIRSSFAPDEPGTRISDATHPTPFGVKTVTAVRRQALVTVEGPGLAGIPGIARRIFAASERSATNVVMISQASSEATVSLVVAAPQVVSLLTSLQQEFALEQAAGLISPVSVQPDVAVVSIIGEGMSGQPGVSARLFGALGRIGVNVAAIAQGGNELSVSVAVADVDVDRAVRAVHAAFGLRRTLDLVLLGLGRVGRAFLDVLGEAADELARARNLQLRVIGAVGRDRAVIDGAGIPIADVARRLAAAGPVVNVAWLDAVERVRSAEVVVVDLTAGDTVSVHTAALSRGMHVVTANKKPLSGTLTSYRALTDAVRATGAHYGFETTFGAGLPVLHTLRELLLTGDSLHAVTGCFSGTLGFLCTRLQDGVGLAEAVSDAVAAGYTEPDPRDDLSGLDVARKALIVARAAGFALEPADIVRTPFVDDLEEGLEVALRRHGAAFSARVRSAAAAGAVLRYVAEIRVRDDKPGGCDVRVGLREVAADSAIGALRGPDNILVFQTARYRDYPLVIRGPGAGAHVTAAGVVGDLIRVAAGT